MKKLLSLLLTSALTVAMLAGCGGGGDTTTTETADTGDGKVYNVCNLVNGNLGDKSFFDSAEAGLKELQDAGRITYTTIEMGGTTEDEAKWQGYLDEVSASGEYDLIICVGAEQVDALTNVATTYPDQKFALLDANSDLDNVASYSCKEQEGAFLAGALAVLAKQEKIDDKLNDGKVIGFIGGVDNPLINHFAAGYQAGAQYIDPDMQVLIDYAGSFNDPTTAKTIANTFVEKGADVIFHASGASGMGMFQAAEEKGFVAIGVNLNQNEIAPDYIMASMLKKLDSCAYHAITSVVEGTYTGENQVLGLSDGGVDVTTEKSNIQVSDSIKEQLDDLKAKVISGEIEVPYELK